MVNVYSFARSTLLKVTTSQTTAWYVCWYLPFTDMSNEPEQEYDDALIALLETIWGEGFLSPGGPEEVDLVLRGCDLRDKRVLDIGCGCGGIDLLLVEKYGASEVIAIDIESRVIERARELASARGLGDRIAFQRIEPGPLAFDDASFDVVFSKDAIIHIPDKVALAGDVFRILQPGGLFAASDWLRGPGEPSEEMNTYLELEGLDFGMADAKTYRSALEQAGFVDIALTDRNAWYRGVAKEEVARMSGPLYDRLVEIQGSEFADHEIHVWEAMIAVLEKGELRPTHLRARKPVD